MRKVQPKARPPQPLGIRRRGLEGQEIRMEDVLGKGTRKRPSAATEDVDELQAETRRFYFGCQFPAIRKHQI